MARFWQWLDLSKRFECSRSYIVGRFCHSYYFANICLELYVKFIEKMLPQNECSSIRCAIIIVNLLGHISVTVSLNANFAKSTAKFSHVPNSWVIFTCILYCILQDIGCIKLTQNNVYNLFCNIHTVIK